MYNRGAKCNPAGAMAPRFGKFCEEIFYMEVQIGKNTAFVPLELDIFSLAPPNQSCVAPPLHASSPHAQLWWKPKTT